MKIFMYHGRRRERMSTQFEINQTNRYGGLFNASTNIDGVQSVRHGVRRLRAIFQCTRETTSRTA
jgi:hypothetical protein